MSDADRPAGTLTYSFDKRLTDVLKDSAIWGKINIPVLMSFSSKYAISLYENAAQFSGLTKKTYQEYSLEDFREMLGVEEGRYPMFGALNKHVIKPAVAEVNALASFNLMVFPEKKGKRVIGVRLAWYAKTNDEAKAARQEVQREKTGRKARIAGNAEAVLEPFPSVNRRLRNSRKAFDPNSPQYCPNPSHMVK